jgi:hypothetical protein
MPRYIKDDPDHWLGRAEEMMAVAEMITDPVVQKSVQVVADGYRQLAEHARRVVKMKQWSERVQLKLAHDLLSERAVNRQ